MARRSETVTLSQIDDLTIQTVDPGQNDYSQAALEAAFARVENADHWKGSIDAIVDLADGDRDLIWVAVVHFTATEPTFERLLEETELAGEIVRVRADGYWAGPAA